MIGVRPLIDECEIGVGNGGQVHTCPKKVPPKFM
jgi:hypothetical protein